ncbi:MAG: DNA polymerase IV [Thermoanaerobaculia bacterium]|nr:DNA polymerase IV [Thermoanaerobaculia bacterium]
MNESRAENEARPEERPRRILHCDMDCFYAAVHVRDDPALAGKPVVIGGSPEGRGVVAAASYEARRFGVRSAMPAARARRLCPGAIFLRPEFDRYRAESARVFEILRDISDRVQAVSIDEAYIDVTESFEAWGSATAVAEEIRRRVATERRLTMSVGVGPNKLVAKIASDFDKPDGLTVVPPRRVGRFLAPLSVRALPGVGPATQERLERSGLRTVADLRGVDRTVLTERFGRYGETLYRYARGIDRRPVVVHRERKSLSSERTFAEDLESTADQLAAIERLAERVAAGLERRDLAARTLTLKVRYADFTTVSRSLTLAWPTRLRELLGSLASELLERTEAAQRPVRLLGVGASKLSPAGEGQMTLFDERS